MKPYLTEELLEDCLDVLLIHLHSDKDVRQEGVGRLHLTNVNYAG